MSFIYLHFPNCKLLTCCSIDGLRFQKPLAIGPFWIPRYQDFWDKSLGWFLGFQIRSMNNAVETDHAGCNTTIIEKAVEMYTIFKITISMKKAVKSNFDFCNTYNIEKAAERANFFWKHQKYEEGC